MDERPPSTAQVARDVGTTPATLRRWLERGLIPHYDGEWTPAAVAGTRRRTRATTRFATFAAVGTRGRT